MADWRSNFLKSQRNVVGGYQTFSTAVANLDPQDLKYERVNGLLEYCTSEKSKACQLIMKAIGFSYQ